MSCDGPREDKTADGSQGKREITVKIYRDEAHLQRISDLLTPNTRNTWDFDTQDQDLGTRPPLRTTTVGFLQRASQSSCQKPNMPAILLLEMERRYSLLLFWLLNN